MTPDPESAIVDPSQPEHISDVRALLIEQLRTLKEAPMERLKDEIQRSKAMSEIAQVVVNSAKVEVDYIDAVKGASESTFLQEREQDQVYSPPSTPQSPLPSAPVDALGRIGPPKNHPWRGSIVRHKLKA